MEQSKENRARIRRISIPPEPGNPRYNDPRLPKERETPSIDPTYVPGPEVEAKPYDLPSPGDRIDREGYIELFRIDEQNYSPTVQEGPNQQANETLEKNTYCLVRLSRSSERSDSVKEFRILYHGTTQVPHVGEKLAISMGVVATLKDAFINKCRVALHGELSMLEVRVYTGFRGGATEFTTTFSDFYYELQSVDLIRVY